MLQYLLEEGIIQRIVRSSSPLAEEGPPSNAEERMIFWVTDKRKHWYQV